jgi:uncharacterized RDD family membrane protein YckC
MLRASAMVADRICIYGVWLLFSLLVEEVIFGLVLGYDKSARFSIPELSLYDIDSWIWWLALLLLFVYGLPGLVKMATIGTYVVLTMTLRGATPGMRMFALRVRRKNDAPLTWPRLLWWHIASYVSGLAFGLGYVWALFDSRGRTWHDIAAGVVIEHIASHERSGGST